MKSFDMDAKLLIKKYIDSIEEYLQEHAQLHPNEIDGLLNEINDFIYLRSEEISTDPKSRVKYTDVLKAIDECGSPSEICDQYLEKDHNSSNEHFLPRLREKSLGIQSTKEDFGAQDILKTKKRINIVDTDIRSKIVSEQIKFYTKSPLFSLYRFLFLLFIGYLFFLAISTNPIIYINSYNWWAWVYRGTSIYIEFYEAYWSTIGICFFLTFYFTLLVLWESFIINGWKKQLTKKNNTSHELDNKIILFLSRFGFLTVFFKASVLLSFVYVIFIPLWVLLLLLSERQMCSELWVKKLAPLITRIGLRLALTGNTSIKTIRKPDMPLIKRKIPIGEFIFGSALALLFGFTFLYPEILKSYVGDYIFFNRDFYFYSSPYDIQYPIGFSLILVIFSLLYLIIFKFIHHFKKDEEVISHNFMILNWLIRLLTLKIVILSVSYTTPISSLYQNFIDFEQIYYITFLIIVGWLAIEILINSYGVQFTRKNIGKALIKVGGSPTIYVGLDEGSLIGTTRFNKKNGNDTPKKDLKSSSISYSVEKRPSVRYKIFFSIFITISLFTAILFEIFLILLTLYTPFTFSGEIMITFILIGIHVLAVVILDTYRLASNKPSGMTIKIGRIITFALLGWLILVNLLIYINPTILFRGYEYIREEFFRMEFRFRVIFIVIMPLFSEIAIWRNKRERLKSVI